MNIEEMLLPHEDPAEFREHLHGLFSAHKPADAHERWLVEELAAASWTWRRARANDKEFWEYIGGHYNRGNLGIAEAVAQEKEARFRTHLRVMAQAERQYYRALAAVERIHRNRGKGRPIQEPVVSAAPIPEPAWEGFEPAPDPTPQPEAVFRDNWLTRPLTDCYSEPCERARLASCAGFRAEMKPGQHPAHLINSPPSSSSISQKSWFEQTS